MRHSSSNSPPAASASTSGAISVQIARVEGLDQDLHTPAAALAEIGPERLIDDPRRSAPGGQHFAGDVEHAEFELPAADGAVEGAVGPHDHARARLPRGGALHVMHGDRERRLRAAPRNRRAGARPSPHRPPPQRLAGAQDRLRRRGRIERHGLVDGSSAWTASASAQNTLFASISGGSPTALER